MTHPRGRQLSLSVATFFALVLAISCNSQPSTIDVTPLPNGFVSVDALLQTDEFVTPAIVEQSVTLLDPSINSNELGCAVAESPSPVDGWHNLVPDEDPWFINYIEGDSNGRMWFATDGNGVFMFDNGEWIQHSTDTRSDVRGDAIRGFAVTDDNIYAGEYGSFAGGGVMIYDIQADKWTNYWPGESELTGGGVGGIAVTDDGTAYLPAAAFTLEVTSDDDTTTVDKARAKLNILKDGAWMAIDVPAFDAQYNDALIDSSGHYWVATSGAIWRYDGSEWETYSGIDAQTLATDSVGNIWAAGKAGLALFDGTWHLFPRESFPLGEHWMVAAEVDAQDRVWFVTQESVSVYNGTEWMVFTSESMGLEYGFDNAIGFDSFECAWVATDFYGLFVFNSQLNMKGGDYSFLDIASSE